MRFTIAVSLTISSIIAVLFCIPLFAADIKCFSGSEIIYQGEAEDIRYNDGVLLFLDSATKKRVFTDADCIVYIADETTDHKK